MILFLLVFLLLIYFMFFIHTNTYEVANVPLLFKIAFSFSHDFSIVIAMHKTCVWVMHWPAAYTVYTYINHRSSSIKNKYHTFLMLLTSVSSSFVPKLVQKFLHMAKITVSVLLLYFVCLGAERFVNMCFFKSCTCPWLRKNKYLAAINTLDFRS